MKSPSKRTTRTRRTIGVASIVGVLLLVGGLIATAFADYAQVGSYSDVQEPRKAAVESSTGNLFVVDQATDQVKVLAPSGNNLSDLTSFGAAVLDEPYGIAIDESGANSAIYVSSQSNGGEIVKFTSDGEATPSFTVDGTFTPPAAGNANDQIGDFHAALALAPNGDLWVADPGNNLLKRFDSSGAHVGGSNIDGSTSGIAFEGLMDVATDSTGDLLVVDSNGDVANGVGTSRVERFAADGTHEHTIGPVGPSQRPASIAINDDDQVIVSGEQDAVYRDQSPIVQVYGADGSLVEEPALSGVTYDTIHGLAASGPKAYVVHDVGRYFAATYGTPGVKVLLSPRTPRPSMHPVEPDDVSMESALVSGEVDPNGLETTYRFEYRTGDEEWKATSAVSAGAGTDAVPTDEVSLDGLQRNKAYEVRLRATNVEGEAVTPPTEFRTKPSAPGIEHARAVEVEQESAWLVAKINPYGAETTYSFKWGEGTSLDRTAPILAQSVGDGHKYRIVETELNDLKADQTYSFLITASNEHGSSESSVNQFTTRSQARTLCPNEAVRHLQMAQWLPDCRAFEQVSPVDKGGVDVQNVIQISQDGKGIAFSALAPQANAVGSAASNVAASVRSDEGWETQSFMPRLSDINRPGVNVVHGGYAFSDEMTSVRLQTAARLDPVDTDGTPTLGSRDVYKVDSDGHGILESKNIDGPLSNESRNVALKAVSADGSTSFFTTNERLDPQAPPNVQSLYRTRHGIVQLVSLDENGLPLPTASGLGRNVSNVATGSGDGGMLPDAEAVSADGRSFVYATTQTNDARLYLRKSDGTTILLSQSQRSDDAGTPATGANIRFRAATPDLARIFFSAEDQLTNTAPPGGGTYRYDTADDHIDFMAPTVVSQNNNEGFIAESYDGEYVFFASQAALTGEAQAQDDDLTNIYVTDGVETDLVGLLRIGVGDDALSIHRGSSHAKVGMDDYSRRFVFQSSVDQGVGSSAGTMQVYAYSLASKELACVSCRPDNSASRAPSRIEERAELVIQQPRVVSSDGQRIVFESDDRVLPQDTNSATDVYEWVESGTGECDRYRRSYSMATGGCTYLISSGVSNFPSTQYGISADGETILFLTRSSLTGTDRDGGLVDIYAAQAEGGEVTTEVIPCEAEGCLNGAQGQPPDERPGSSAFSGSGNAEARNRRCRQLARKALSARRQARELKRAAAAAGPNRRHRLRRAARAKLKHARRLNALARECRAGQA